MFHVKLACEIFVRVHAALKKEVPSVFQRQIESKAAGIESHTGAARRKSVGEYEDNPELRDGLPQADKV